MATLKITFPAVFTNDTATANRLTIWNNISNFIHQQQANKMLWFFLMLMVHGVFILPLPIVLTYYFNAPAWIVAITMISFFANVIANMAGGGIKIVMTLFALSMAVHFILALIFII